MTILDKVPQSGVNNRLEAFCDGVFSFALTLLVVNLVKPAAVDIKSSAAFWSALLQLLPEFLCFLLSFCIIVITWSAHHSTFKLVDKSSPRFIMANALLLMTIVLLPFATSILSEFIMTESAGPAILVFSILTLLSNLSWMHLYRSALPLTTDETREAMKVYIQQSKMGFMLYSGCVLASLSFPLSTALAQATIWFLWLFHDVNAERKLE